LACIPGDTTGEINMTLYEVLMNEDIDESIREVLIELNTAGYDTKYSCSGAPSDHIIREEDTGENGELVLYDNKSRCYLVLRINDMKRSSYIKELRKKLYGTNWYIQYTFNTCWKWQADVKRWYNSIYGYNFIDRVTLEYSCEFLDKECQRAWNTLLERLL
jgi:hypothetical protein